MNYHNHNNNNYANNRHHGGNRHGGGDSAFCYIHRKKRLRADLMPVGDGSGRLRCLPNKECRFVEVVVCRKHRRRRNAAQMRQVEPGVWECTADFECRGPGNNNNNNMHRHQRLGGRPVERHGGEGGGQSAWAPSAASAGGVRPGIRRDRNGAPIMVHKQVWCVRHGKRLQSNQCAAEEETCRVCVDKSACLSTPLDTPEDLHGQGCMEVLCREHHTLRSVGFVELAPDRTGYQCVKGHPCRWKTLQHVDKREDDKNARPASAGHHEEDGRMVTSATTAMNAGFDGMMGGADGGVFVSPDMGDGGMMPQDQNGMDVFFGVGGQPQMLLSQQQQQQQQGMSSMMMMMGGEHGGDSNQDGSTYYANEAASLFM